MVPLDRSSDGLDELMAGTGAPTMSSYFATFPSAATTILSPTSKIYKYIGGELGPTNPFQVAPGSEKLDSTKAYWIQAPLVGNFTGPVEYELPSVSGLAFGRTISSMTTGVTNRSTTSVTLCTAKSSSPAIVITAPSVLFVPGGGSRGDTVNETVGGPASIAEAGCPSNRNSVKSARTVGFNSLVALLIA